MELAHIAANKNTVPGDVSAMVPGGIRMGEFACMSVVQELLVQVPHSTMAEGCEGL